MRLLILPGDGIGPEITAVVVDCLSAIDCHFGLGLELEFLEVGTARLAKFGKTAPGDLLDLARAADGIILGPLSTSDYPAGAINVSAVLRKELDLYANIRPSRTLAGATCRPFDLILVRENTEGFLSDRVMAAGSGEVMPTPDLAIAMRKITAGASKRIAQTAFNLARTRKQHVTAVHKNNSLKISDGLFLREVRAISACYPDVLYDEILVDAMASLLVRCPERFDVVVTTNLFGDILSNEASELAGSLGLAGSLNVGSEYAMAQSVHGSAIDIAGRDISNPIGLVSSTAMLLAWLGTRRGRSDILNASASLVDAIDEVLSQPTLRTADLGGICGTHALGQALLNNLKLPGKAFL
jgi:isocitrate/isopropylmalate dehydrogenase